MCSKYFCIICVLLKVCVCVWVHILPALGWHSFVSEFLHVSAPQELGKSLTWFKFNNNECPNTAVQHTQHHTCTHTVHHQPPRPRPPPLPCFFSPTSESCFHFYRSRGSIRPDTCMGGIWRLLENKCCCFIWIIYGLSTLYGSTTHTNTHTHTHTQNPRGNVLKWEM